MKKRTRSKSPWKSKTIWTGLLTAVVGPVLPFVLPAKVAAAVLTAAGGLIGVFARMGILEAEEQARDAVDRAAAATERAHEAGAIAWRVERLAKEARAADSH